MNLADIPIGSQAPDIIPVVIEIPQKSRNKYLYDLELELFRLKRVLHSAVQYPTAYGFIPQTLWDDDEPLDAMVLCDETLSPGVILDVRPIGMLAMKDQEIVDSKILTVPVGDPRYRDVTDISHVAQHRLNEIEHFFENYKHLEGKHVKSFGWSTCIFAKQSILRGNKAYKKHHAWRSSPDE